MYLCRVGLDGRAALGTTHQGKVDPGLSHFQGHLQPAMWGGVGGGHITGAIVVCCVALYSIAQPHTILHHFSVNHCVCVCVCVSSPRVVPGKGLLEGPHWLAVGAQYATLNVVERVHSTTNDVADLVEELQQNKPR